MQDAPIYNPPESTLDSVCALIADPAHSLLSAAEALNTTPAALALFILKPEISAKLLLHAQTPAFKARISACQALPELTDALRSSIQEFAHETRNAPYQLESSRAVEYRRRSRETARKTGALLLRIATFDPAKPTRPSTPRPQRTQFLDQAYPFSLTPSPSHLISSLSFFTGPQPLPLHTTPQTPSTPPSSPSPASASASSSSSASSPSSPSSSSSSSSQISNLNSEISTATPSSSSSDSSSSSSSSSQISTLRSEISSPTTSTPSSSSCSSSSQTSTPNSQIPPPPHAPRRIPLPQLPTHTTPCPAPRESG